MSKKVLEGVSWLTFAQGIKVLVTSFVMLWLAKILDVEVFGIFAIANVFIQFFRTISNIGIDSAIIQNKENIKDYFFTLNLYLCAAGLFFYLICWIGAFFLAEFYENNDILQLFRIMAISIPLGSLGVVSRGILLKELKYNQVAVSDLVSVLLSSIVAVVIAFKSQGYWALVMQLIVMSAISSSLYLIFYLKENRVSFSVHFEQIKEILKFGMNVLLFNALNFFSQQIDIMLIGKFLGEKETGYYYLAFNIVAKPFGVLIQSFNQSIYPILAKVQETKIAYNYKKYTYPFVIVVSLGVITYIGFAKILIPVLLTDKWIAILPLVLFFGVQVVMQAFGSSSGLLFLLSGKPEKQWHFSLFVVFPFKVLGILIGFFLISQSSVGVVLGTNITAFISTLMGFYVTFKLVGLDIKSYFAPISLFLGFLIFYILISELLCLRIENIWLLAFCFLFFSLGLYWIVFRTNKKHFNMILESIKKNRE